MIPKAYFMLANAILEFIDKTKDEAVFDEELYMLWMLDVLSQPRCVRDLLFRVNPKEHTQDTLPLAITSERHRNLLNKNRIFVHAQAMGYLRCGVEPTLSVRNLTNAGLSKAHFLYAEYAKHVHDDNWIKSSIGRKKGEIRIPVKSPEKEIQSRFFPRLSQEYPKGSASPKALEELGKVILDLETSDLTLPEEMSVKDVLNAAPKASLAEREETRELKNYIVNTLDSAGERYSALRRCGLDPNDWYSAPEPSISTLREFAKFIDEL
ncbi:hypothetical protein [Terasakiella pusilla]|uniref:hypothetical protein n=1 Tax=Terasakiella pusilla TaxID=64973 RepID=UPI00048BDD9A|nr:hypothetical protein [Terasakiella pusilla]